MSNYTFNDYGIPDQSFTATNGGPFLTAAQDNRVCQHTAKPRRGAQLRDDVHRQQGKRHIQHALVLPTSGIIGVVNIPTASDGLTSLTFNVSDGGNDIVSFINVPDITGDTAFNDGPGNDVTNVMGDGIPSDQFMDANGGGGINTLNYDADGETPTIQPDGNGGVIITHPRLRPARCHQLPDHQHHQTPAKRSSSRALPTMINTVEGFQTVNAITGTFTVTQPVIVIPTPPDYNTPTPLAVGSARERLRRDDRLGRPVPRPRCRHDHPGRQ